MKKKQTRGFNPEDLTLGWAAVRYAQEVREYHRRSTKKGNPSREQDIKVALSKLKRAMRPLRSLRARSMYAPLKYAISDADKEKIAECSEAIQAERRKLWKMQRRKKGT